MSYNFTNKKEQIEACADFINDMVGGRAWADLEDIKDRKEKVYKNPESEQAQLNRIYSDKSWDRSDDLSGITATINGKRCDDALDILLKGLDSEDLEKVEDLLDLYISWDSESPYDLTFDLAYYETDYLNKKKEKNNDYKTGN